MPISSDLFTKTLALLAFTVAFYALAARERKTPYITNFLYSTVFWIILSSFLQILAQLIEPFYSKVSIVLQYLARGFLVIGAVTIIYGIWRIHNRHVNFRDDFQFKNLGIPRWIRRQLPQKKGPVYNFDPPKLHPDLLTDLNNAIRECNTLGEDQVSLAATQINAFSNDHLSKSIIYHDASLLESDNLMVRLAQNLLCKGWALQYTTCIRHPIEFIEKLRKVLDEQNNGDSRELFKEVVVIDAYTPHFGFTDSVHYKMTASLKGRGIHCVTSSPSYAGIHTATAKAFNKLKKQHTSQNQSRKPTFIIYEGAFAIVDLESIEQYRIFVRHVLPSERLWGGMLTFVVEPVISEDALSVLSTYADVLLGEKKDAVLLDQRAPNMGAALIEPPMRGVIPEASHEIKQ
jgi:hypothetical protein